MINQILTYGITIPVTFIFINLVLFWAFTAMKSKLAEALEEITTDWVAFMGRGIPIPTEPERFDVPFAGEPILIRPEFRVTDTTTTVLN